MAGYSGTPLVKKLGLKPGALIKTLHEPDTYWKLLSPLPEGVQRKTKAAARSLDFIHLFAEDKNHFEKGFIAGKELLKATGMMWVSWPKKSSGVATDLDENVIREFGLAHGLVDVKVCAIDAIWSGLKFVYRILDRPGV